MLTGVIDYGAGNLRSVCNALTMLHTEHKLIRGPEDLNGIDALVFPGVGAFGESMQHLVEQDLVAPIFDWIKADRPFLGICIGYQVLFEGSEECPGTPGLGVFKGQVTRFSPESKLKVPHMGWNNITPLDASDPLWKELPKSPFVYFVHSFFPRPEDQSIVSSTAKHGETFAASIRSGNVTATQFHPEKSQSVGLQLIRNFLDSAMASVAV
jgi:glutamine amidotransferase